MPRASHSTLLLCATGTALLTGGFFLGRTTAPALSNFPSSALLPFSASAIADVRPSASSTSPASSNNTPALSTANWPASLAIPSTPASEDAQRACLRTLATTNPTLALQLAQAAPSPRQRDEFIRAALQGWAASAPLDAARWTLDHVRLGERRLAAEALLSAAIAQPEAAIQAAHFLCASDPLLQSDHGNALVTAFASAGRFDLASQFAATAPGEFRAHWLSTAFSRWAQHQPSSAIAAAHELPDATARTEALQGVITGWAMSDPAALVANADKLPAGETRATALRDGLQQWVSLDPIAASAWMDRLDPSRDLDAGAAAVATTAVIAQKNPDVAASWAESIVDPELRANTLLDFIRLWAERDPSAARSYAANSPALRPETRASALASFEPHATP
ncbi:hypothetical protein CMV30_08210 [Nibricoccus aquaticus]|uniref:Uncharacterized protein n=1 Tax=Nibricoccus aquaticus TaxID=2576891 RepID=A0A290Q6P1_9BACT|nr:hypothetical protein [Nibricoccus aquaticus]ATC63937.1 hypothetical protein CMV30_08210 [Nibricoccus aquaticus]